MVQVSQSLLQSLFVQSKQKDYHEKILFKRNKIFFNKSGKEIAKSGQKRKYRKCKRIGKSGYHWTSRLQTQKSIDSCKEYTYNFKKNKKFYI